MKQQRRILGMTSCKASNLMMRYLGFNLKAVILCHCLFLLINNVHASEADNRKYTFSMSSFIQKNKYKEVDNKIIINRESGQSNGYKLSGSVAKNNWLFGLSYHYANGNLAYKGLTSRGQYKFTDTEHKQTKFELLLKYDLAKLLKDFCFSCSALYLGAGVEQNKRNRNILTKGTIFGLNEKYVNKAIQFNIELNYKLSNSLINSNKLSYTRSIDNELEIHFLNNYDPENINLKPENKLELSSTFEYEFSKAYFITLSAGILSYSMPKSTSSSLFINDVIQSSSFYQPKQEYSGYYLSLGFKSLFSGK